VATLRRHSPLRNCSGVWIDFPELPREGGGNIFSLRGHKLQPVIVA
jgi:hypothetical protein